MPRMRSSSKPFWTDRDTWVAKRALQRMCAKLLPALILVGWVAIAFFLFIWKLWTGFAFIFLSAGFIWFCHEAAHVDEYERYPAEENDLREPSEL